MVRGRGAVIPSLTLIFQPENMRQIDPRNLNAAARAEYDRLKRLIYRGVCETVMASLQHRSHRGEALRFGDGIVRVAHPGVLIESMDFEELAAWLAIRNSRSLHPCPQCLVHKDDLHRLSRSYRLRTAAGMSTALAQAPISSKTQRNEFLKGYGLHDFEVSSSMLHRRFKLTCKFSISCGRSPTPTRTKRPDMTAFTFSMAESGGDICGSSSKNTFRLTGLQRTSTQSGFCINSTYERH
jgi:hypothetical protein